MTIAAAREVLKTTFGYESFRPGQEQVVATLLEGGHALAVMPTGAGKSLCFQIPALIRDGLTIVVSPLVALMEDQVAALRLAGVAAEAINSSRSYEDNADSWRRAAAGTAPLLYMAPERLMTERMLTALSRLPVNLIAIDEAHCISRWGPAFRPEYEALSQLKDRFPGVPIAALTATADGSTQEDIASQLFAGRGRVFVSSFDRPNIHMTVEMRRSWKQQLLTYVQARADQSGIVYCLSRKKTEEAAAYLSDHGIDALPYHAGMDKARRAAHQDQFMTRPNVIMVATIAFGMGIDKPDVRFVYHTDLPGNMEAYYQELGRAGRDGAPAEAFMLYGFDDIRMRRMFIDQEDSESDHKRREHKRLDTLIAFCESPTCRRQVLLAYFGERTEPCGNCDICLNPPDLADGSEVAGMLLAAVRETGQMFGQAHLIDILRGGDTEKIRNARHNTLAVHGVGKDIDRNEWRSIVRQMVASGYLRLDIKGFGGLSLTEAGAALAEGRGEFRYRRDTVRGAARPASKKPAAALADLDETEAHLFNALKEVRLDLARQQGVPPYVIFPDKALADMAKKKPATQAEFAEVHGVGAAKLRKFGDIFLAAIAGEGGS